MLPNCLRPHRFARLLLSVSLSVALALPSPVWALRPTLNRAGLEHTLNPEQPSAAGVEEEKSIQIGRTRVELVQGNITEQKVEAIVNAANRFLAGGGGVDGAIHTAAGPSVQRELDQRYLYGIQPGEAVISGAGKLSQNGVKYIIHAVGPVYTGDTDNSKVLASAYRASLTLCGQHYLTSVAFPSIATGLFGYPVDEAARIAIRAIGAYLHTHPQTTLRKIRFVLFDDATYQAYAAALKDYAASLLTGMEESGFVPGASFEGRIETVQGHRGAVIAIRNAQGEERLGWLPNTRAQAGSYVGHLRMFLRRDDRKILVRIAEIRAEEGRIPNILEIDDAPYRQERLEALSQIQDGDVIPIQVHFTDGNGFYGSFADGVVPCFVPRSTAPAEVYESFRRRRGRAWTMGELSVTVAQIDEGGRLKADFQSVLKEPERIIPDPTQPPKVKSPPAPKKPPTDQPGKRGPDAPSAPLDRVDQIMPRLSQAVDVLCAQEWFISPKRFLRPFRSTVIPFLKEQLSREEAGGDANRTVWLERLEVIEDFSFLMRAVQSKQKQLQVQTVTGGLLDGGGSVWMKVQPGEKRPFGAFVTIRADQPMVSITFFHDSEETESREYGSMRFGNDYDAQGVRPLLHMDIADSSGHTWVSHVDLQGVWNHHRNPSRTLADFYAAFPRKLFIRLAHLSRIAPREDRITWLEEIKTIDLEQLQLQHPAIEIPVGAQGALGISIPALYCSETTRGTVVEWLRAAGLQGQVEVRPLGTTQSGGWVVVLDGEELARLPRTLDRRAVTILKLNDTPCNSFAALAQRFLQGRGHDVQVVGLAVLQAERRLILFV